MPNSATPHVSPPERPKDVKEALDMISDAPLAYPLMQPLLSYVTQLEAMQQPAAADTKSLKNEVNELRATIKDLRNAFNGMTRERGRNVTSFNIYAKRAKAIINTALTRARAIGSKKEAAG